jgi:hypothetical protein
MAPGRPRDRRKNLARQAYQPPRSWFKPMRLRPGVAVLFLLLAAPALPAAQAGLVPEQDYASTLAYAPGFSDQTNSFAFLSGALSATTPHVDGAFGFFGSSGALLNGVEMVCIADGSANPCHSSPGLTVTVPDGGAFAVDFPAATDASASAGHALGLFVDFKDERDLKSLNLQKTLVASAVDGQARFDRIPAIPVTSAQALLSDAQSGKTSGRIVALDSATTLTVADSNFHRTVGVGVPVLFQGSALTLGPVRAATLVLPFESGSTSTWTPADGAAATEGLQLQRLSGIIDSINNASQKGGASDGINVDGLDEIQPLLARVLDGALMQVPTKAANLSDVLQHLSLVRLDRLTASSDGTQLALAGPAPLSIQSGRVQGAEALVGFSYFQLPWWSFVLWGLAIAAFIVRLAMGKSLPKPNQTRWHRLRWIGWAAGPLCFLLLFWLWDLEVLSVWGVSLFSALGANLGGQALLVVAAIEVTPFLLMLFAVATPLRILFRACLRIGRQGAFMNLSAPVAYLLSILLGAGLMLSYLDLVLQQLAA